jgi:ABC-type lipoprotein release transport system permease subunit
MLLDASAGGTIKNKTPAEVEELIEMMSRNEYNKAEDIDERDILLGKMVTSELEIERLVKKIEEITPQKKRDEHATRRESEA